MLKRLKVSILLAAAFGASLFGSGCAVLPWGGDADNVWHILAAILREDLFS